MDYNKSAQEVLDAIGGSENIRNYEHCATRLRIVLRDNEKLDKEKAENVEGLQGYFYSSGQH